jgi:plastocyanin
MTRRIVQTLAMGGVALALASCGGSSSGGGGTVSGGGTPGFYITIRGMAFSPLELSVPAGQTVTVLNQDAMPHTVTSEAAAGDFTPGSVGGVQFDTGSFTGQTSFTIPANAPNGTVIPYYCRVHTTTMATPTGTIKVDDTAQPTPAPGSGGGGGGGGGGY